MSKEFRTPSPIERAQILRELIDLGGVAYEADGDGWFELDDGDVHVAACFRPDPNEDSIAVFLSGGSGD